MSGIRAFLREHAVGAYLALVFVISWGAFLSVIGPASLRGAPRSVDALLVPAILTMLLGPPIAAVSMTLALEGRAGVRKLLARLRAWRAPRAAYALGVLVGPVLALGLSLAFALATSAQTFAPRVLSAPAPVAMVVAGLLTGLAAGLFEEIGWTGFATPRLLARHGRLAAGLLLGSAWALWHVLPALWVWMSVGPLEPLGLVGFVLDPFLFLVGFRVLMVALYDRTGSLPLAIVAHASLTATARILLPELPGGAAMLAFDVTWALAMGALVALVLRSGGARDLTRGSRDRRA